MNETTPAPTYALAYLRDVDLGPAIFDYLRRIDETLVPHGGRFLVHGGQIEEMEGDWAGGDVVVIEFPDATSARGWYTSAAYQAILPLRTEHSRSMTALLPGVPRGYRAVDGLAALRAEPV